MHSMRASKGARPRMQAMCQKLELPALSGYALDAFS
jgi:hypothetical protein